jgi:hypothetical protein
MAKYRYFPAKFRQSKWQNDCYRRNFAQIAGRNETEQLNPRTWLRLTVSGDLPDEQRDQCCRLPVGPPPLKRNISPKRNGEIDIYFTKFPRTCKKIYSVGTWTELFKLYEKNIKNILCRIHICAISRCIFKETVSLRCA